MKGRTQRQPAHKACVCACVCVRARACACVCVSAFAVVLLQSLSVLSMRTFLPIKTVTLESPVVCCCGTSSGKKPAALLLGHALWGLRIAGEFCVHVLRVVQARACERTVDAQAQTRTLRQTHTHTTRTPVQYPQHNHTLPLFTAGSGDEVVACTGDKSVLAINVDPLRTLRQRSRGGSATQSPDSRGFPSPGSDASGRKDAGSDTDTAAANDQEDSIIGSLLEARDTLYEPRSKILCTAMAPASSSTRGCACSCVAVWLCGCVVVWLCDCVVEEQLVLLKCLTCC